MVRKQWREVNSKPLFFFLFFLKIFSFVVNNDCHNGEYTGPPTVSSDETLDRDTHKEWERTKNVRKVRRWEGRHNAHRYIITQLYRYIQHYSPSLRYHTTKTDKESKKCLHTVQNKTTPYACTTYLNSLLERVTFFAILAFITFLHTTPWCMGSAMFYSSWLSSQELYCCLTLSC